MKRSDLVAFLGSGILVLEAAMGYKLGIVRLEAKENLKAKIKLDKPYKKLVSTMKEPPGKWWLGSQRMTLLMDLR